MARPLEVLAAFLRLGCTSFGGPVAHLAYFRTEFVERRRWLEDATFGECVALTQLLPGPGSSQTGMLIGWLAAGPLGALCAWIGFTLPSAVAMTAIALAAGTPLVTAGWLHALLLVATGVVASAIVTMRHSLAPDAQRLAIALAVLALVLLWPSPAAAPIGILASALAGAFLLRGQIPAAAPKLDLGISRRAGAAILALFILTLVTLEVAARVTQAHPIVLFDLLFRVGSLVFGGGHVVLPLLQTQAAAAGVVSSRAILEGYAAAQAMPGPLFTIASFVGAAAYNGSLGVCGAILGTIAIFAPSFALLAGVAPFYRALATNERFRAALAGANAGVIGLLAGAFVNPIWTSAVHNVLDVCFAGAAFLAVHVLKVPAWAVVLAAAFIGELLFR